MLQTFAIIVSLVAILVTTTIIIAKGADIKQQYDDKLKLMTDQINASEKDNSQVDKRTNDNINEIRKAYPSKEDIARSIDTRELTSSRITTNDIKSLNITGEFLKVGKSSSDSITTNKLVSSKGVIGELDSSSLKANTANVRQLNFDNAGKYSMNQRDTSLNVNIPDDSMFKINNQSGKVALGDKIDVKYNKNNLTFGIDNKDIVRLYKNNETVMTTVDNTLLVSGESKNFPNISVSSSETGEATTIYTNAITSKSDKPFDIKSREYVRIGDAKINNINFSSKIDSKPAITSDKDNLFIYGELDSKNNRNINLVDNVNVGSSYLHKDKIGSDSINSKKGINIQNNDPGAMIEKKYNNNLGDRYGLGQFPGGDIKLYTATEFPGKLSLSQAKKDGTFDDILTVNSNKSINLNTSTVILPNNNNINTKGRQNLSGDKSLHILNKEGAIIGKEWGGSGNLQVEGNLNTFGNVSGREITTNKINIKPSQNTMLERKWGGDGDRYGVGQFDGGMMRMYTATDYPGKLALSQAKRDSTFEDILLINPDKSAMFKGGIYSGSDNKQPPVGTIQSANKLCVNNACLTESDIKALLQLQPSQQQLQQQLQQLQQQQQQQQQLQLQSSSLYEFGSHIFTNCGVTGNVGPTLAQCRSAYSFLSWTQDTRYFNMTTQGIQLWTVPATGNYTVRIAGAIGGGNNAGKGLIIQATISLVKGSIIKILVGQAGIVGNANASTGGGGGASFMATNTNQPILVAPGGGGSGSVGINSNTTVNGIYTQGSDVAGKATPFGSGGASFTYNSANKTYDNLYTGATSFINGGIGGVGGKAGGWTGGADGGFGGGGGSCSCSLGSGGGGGGYQGGDSINASGYNTGSGGYSYYGGQYVTTNNVSNQGLNAGNGYVIITKI